MGVRFLLMELCALKINHLVGSVKGDNLVTYCSMLLVKVCNFLISLQGVKFNPSLTLPNFLRKDSLFLLLLYVTWINLLMLIA